MSKKKGPQMTAFVKPNRIRVWNEDFPLLRFGQKTEYRIYAGPIDLNPELTFPRPVLIWTKNHAGSLSTALVVEVQRWREMLLAISEESLVNEGFQSLDTFKRYWLLRTGNRPDPLSYVTVHRYRHWVVGDDERFADEVFRTLYGDAWQTRFPPSAGTVDG